MRNSFVKCELQLFQGLITNKKIDNQNERNCQRLQNIAEAQPIESLSRWWHQTQRQTIKKFNRTNQGCRISQKSNNKNTFFRLFNPNCVDFRLIKRIIYYMLDTMDFIF